MKRKAIFLTNKTLLWSEITGGVQLCSQEFHSIIENVDNIEIQDYYVPFTRNIIDRILIRIGLENYSMYDVRNDSSDLINFIYSNKIDIVFINMASAIRYARPLKEKFGNQIKIILLSHGNHSGDFLHLISRPPKKVRKFRRFLDRIRLGLLITTESEYRVKYIDNVVSISETEMHIEKWFGASNSVFLPRRLYAQFLEHSPVIGRIGFVGRLDHPPNLQGIQTLLTELEKLDYKKLDFRLVGAPEKYGQQLQNQFPFVNYLGELSDAHLELEVSKWSFILNPVWWYSTGASTKLGKIISWGIPVITTTAGMRGYKWNQGSLLVSDTPKEMVITLLSSAMSEEKIAFWTEQIRLIANNGPNDTDLVQIIKKTIS